MATTTVLDAIELFNVIGQHYAHPRLDPAAPPLALAGAMQQLFALVETAFSDALRALDVDLAHERLQVPRYGAPARLRFLLSPDPEDARVFVPREGASTCGSSPLSSPAPATPSDGRGPAWSMKGKGKEVMHYPPAPPSSFSFSSVDWNSHGAEDDESDDDEMDESPPPPVPPAPRIVPNAALSVLRTPHIVPQPRWTSSRPPPPGARRRPAPAPAPAPRSSVSSSSASAASSSSTGAASSSPTSAASSSPTSPTSSSSATLSKPKTLTVHRKSPTPAPAKKLARPLAKRHSAPEIATEPRRATRTAKANAQASWSWLVSKRRKSSGSTVAEEDEDV